MPQNLIIGPTHSNSNSNTPPRYRSSGLPTAQGATNTAGSSIQPRHALQLVSACDGLARTCPCFSAGILRSQDWHDGLGPWRRLLSLAQCVCPPSFLQSLRPRPGFFFSMFLGGSGFPSLVLSILQYSTYFCSSYRGRVNGIACRQGARRRLPARAR